MKDNSSSKTPKVAEAKRRSSLLFMEKREIIKVPNSVYLPSPYSFYNHPKSEDLYLSFLMTSCSKNVNTDDL